MYLKITDCHGEPIPNGTVRVSPWKKGSFCRVYEIFDDADNVIKTIPDGVYQLHGLVEAGKGPHLPETELLGYSNVRGQDVCVFQQKKYLPYKTTPDGATLIKVFKTLSKIPRPKSIWDCHPLRMNHEADNGFVDHVKRAGVGTGLLADLKKLGDWLCNYGSQVTWEISPRNLALDEAGNLILLDVFFDPEDLEKVRNSQSGQLGVPIVQ